MTHVIARRVEEADGRIAKSPKGETRRSNLIQRSNHND